MHKRLILLATTLMITLTLNASPTNLSPASITEEFIEDKMSREDYGIRTTYHTPTFSYDYASGNEVLSESMGLMMLHYISTKNEVGFKHLYSFCEQNLKNHPIYVYRENFSTNALIDDFRLVEALLTAAPIFDNASYLDAALSYASVLYETNLFKGNLVDFYDAYYKNQNNTLTLCYVNFKLLDQLSTHDSRWQPILEKTKSIVKDGFISDSFPLYYNNYNYDLNNYNQESIHIVHGLKTLLHLAQIGELPEVSLQWLKQNVSEGTLYGSYSITGEALTDIQSTAAYALAARIAALMNDSVFYEQCIERMEQYHITDYADPLYGAFGNSKTQEAYSFDQLCALLAYDAKALLTEDTSH